MIRYMCRYMRLDITRNEVHRKKVGVAPIEDKIRKTRLRLFVHVKRRGKNAPVKSCETINLSGCRRGRRRRKKVKMR